MSKEMDPFILILNNIEKTVGRLESQVDELQEGLKRIDSHVTLLTEERNQVVGGAKVAIWLFGILGAFVYWLADHRFWK